MADAMARALQPHAPLNGIFRSSACLNRIFGMGVRARLRNGLERIHSIHSKGCVPIVTCGSFGRVSLIHASGRTTFPFTFHVWKSVLFAGAEGLSLRTECYAHLTHRSVHSLPFAFSALLLDLAFPFCAGVRPSAHII